MIIGSGLIAKAFEEYKTRNDIVIFASGVSNSREISKEAFLREEELLISCLQKYGIEKKVIYFSTCSMLDSYFETSDYTKHKIRMEEIIMTSANKYNIFRLPQVLGNNNKNQLVGFLHEQIKNKKSFELFDIERNIIDIEDVHLLVKIVLQANSKNEIINIANINNTKVTNLVNIIEYICKEKAIYSLKSIEGNFNININRIKSIIEKNKIFGSNYLEDRIRKYYE